MNYNFPEWEKTFRKFFQDDFWDEFDSFFSKNFVHPQVNIYESQDKLLCLVLWPLLKSIKNFHIDVDHRTLEVSGRITLEHRGFRLVHQEIFQGDVKREIELPYAVRKDQMETSYEGGLLKICLYRLPDQKHKNRMFIDDD